MFENIEDCKEILYNLVECRKMVESAEYVYESLREWCRLYEECKRVLNCLQQEWETYKRGTLKGLLNTIFVRGEIVSQWFIQTICAKLRGDTSTYMLPI